MPEIKNVKTTPAIKNYMKAAKPIEEINPQEFQDAYFTLTDGAASVEDKRKAREAIKELTGFSNNNSQILLRMLSKVYGQDGLDKLRGLDEFDKLTGLDEFDKLTGLDEFDFDEALSDINEALSDINETLLKMDKEFGEVDPAKVDSDEEEHLDAEEHPDAEEHSAEEIERAKIEKIYNELKQLNEDAERCIAESFKLEGEKKELEKKLKSHDLSDEEKEQLTKQLEALNSSIEDSYKKIKEINEQRKPILDEAKEKYNANTYQELEAKLKEFLTPQEEIPQPGAAEAQHGATEKPVEQPEQIIQPGRQVVHTVVPPTRSAARHEPAPPVVTYSQQPIQQSRITYDMTETDESISIHALRVKGITVEKYFEERGKKRSAEGTKFSYIKPIYVDGNLVRYQFVEKESFEGHLKNPIKAYQGIVDDVLNNPDLNFESSEKRRIRKELLKDFKADYRGTKDALPDYNKCLERIIAMRTVSTRKEFEVAKEGKYPLEPYEEKYKVAQITADKKRSSFLDFFRKLVKKNPDYSLKVNDRLPPVNVDPQDEFIKSHQEIKLRTLNAHIKHRRKNPDRKNPDKNGDDPEP